MKRKLLILACALLLPLLLPAQSRPEVSGALDFNSAYLWRGSRECKSHLAPSVCVEWGHFALETSGYFSFDGTYRELDWDFSFNISDFSLHLADYYSWGGSLEGIRNFFNCRKGETAHIQEVILCYEPSRLPFAVRWFTFLHGDWIPLADGSPGRPSFSSYLEGELFYESSVAGRISLTAGASVFKGSYTDYTRNFALVHLELGYTYTFDLGPVTLPVFVCGMWNPYSRSCYANAGLGIHF